MCAHIVQRRTRQEQRWAESKSHSLMPAGMQACLKPFEVNGEVSKDVSEDQTEPKNANAEGRKKTLICI